MWPKPIFPELPAITATHSPFSRQTRTQLLECAFRVFVHTLSPLGESSPSFSLNGMIILENTYSLLDLFLRAEGVLEGVGALDLDKLGLK